MTRQVLRNARVFDSLNGVVLPAGTVVVVDGRIASVTVGDSTISATDSVDLKGRIVLPGLIDCHVHVTAVHHDVWALSMQPPSYITAQATHILEAMLLRGFTTVRDAAGADYGVQLAIERGFLRGPRLFIAGAPLSQTGGHADIRPRGVKEFMCTCAGLGLFPALGTDPVTV